MTTAIENEERMNGYLAVERELRKRRDQAESVKGKDTPFRPWWIPNFVWRWWTNAAYWEQSHATHVLQDAWGHLYRQYWWQASSKERGKLLPEQQEALDMLHNLAHESLERQCEL